jgi:hypothetical protein
MNTEITSIYWLTLDEIEKLNNIVVRSIEGNENSAILHRIQSEISVVKTREENSLLPSDYITSIMELPENALPIRFSNTELELIKTLPISEKVLERLK